MYEDYVTKMASVVTNYSAPIKPGQVVAINGNTECIPMVRALFEVVLLAGGHPVPMIGVPGLGSFQMKYGTDAQLKFLDPIIRTMYEEVDVIYTIASEVNPMAGSRVDPERARMPHVANAHIMQRFMERLGTGELRWLYFPYPTHGMAQQAEMSLLDYTEFVYKACAFDHEDPIAYWREVSSRQDVLVDYLNDKSRAKIVGPDIELEFAFGGRTWVNCDGKMNFPDGEVFTGPLEESVNGFVNFNIRTVYNGRTVDGVRLEFKDGKVVNASAEKNQEFLLNVLDSDEGARRLGEFAIGTNFGVKEVTGNTLFDEKIGGTIHMAVGHSLPETGGVNVSSVHWDMVYDMEGAEIYIDDELFYKDRQFQIDF